MTSPFLAWLLNYAIHSTFLLVAAFVVTRFVRADALRDVIWKAALIGGMLTAAVPLLVPQFAPRFPVVLPQVVDAVPQASFDENSTVLPQVGNGTTPPRPQIPAQTNINWPLTIAVVWLIGAAVFLLRLVLNNAQLLRRLRDRQLMKDGALPAMVAEVRRNAGYWNPVSVSISDACPTPIALGRKEICVPARFTSELAASQQRVALAHELAHLVRRDPIWQFTARIVESVFFFQPLNRLARTQMRNAAENLSDDWAVVHGGAPLDLAKCLESIASWVGEPVPTGTVAMAEGGSPLLQRVQRLVDWRAPARIPVVLSASAAVIMVVVVTAAAPSASVNPPSVVQVSFDSVTPQRPDSIVRYSSPRDPLSAKWSWALAEGGSKTFWVGWTVDGVNAQHLASTEGGAPDAANSPTVHAMLNDAHSLVLVIGFENGRIARTRIRQPEERLNLAGAPLYWLSASSNDESLMLLRSIYAQTQNAGVRHEIAAAYTMHRSFEPMIAAVAELLKREQSEDVRAEAVQWLPRTHPQERRIVTLLEDVAFRDPSEMVRAEAVDAIAALVELRAPEARNALVRIANRHSSWKLRSEAAQTLAEQNN